MITKTKLMVIDADAHVVETERTWQYMDASEKEFRPRLYSSPENSMQPHWILDNRVCGFAPSLRTADRVKEMSQMSGRTVAKVGSSEEINDVEQRLKDMDVMGAEMQVLHNSFWIEQVTRRPEVENALCRSWNRWVAEMWKQGKGRLRWSCVVPTLTLSESIDQIRFAKENGAVAVAMRPMEGERLMTDRFFYPIYEEASRLGMTIAVHIANGNPTYVDQMRYFPHTSKISGFAAFRAPTALACFILIMSELPHIFPKLHWGFIESSSMWMPWMNNEAKRRSRMAGKTLPDNPFEAFNIFATCQSDDDLPWTLKYAGENTLVLGTDYGHIDPSSDQHAINIINQRDDISKEVREKILCDNPKRLYSL